MDTRLKKLVILRKKESLMTAVELLFKGSQDYAVKKFEELVENLNMNSSHYMGSFSGIRQRPFENPSYYSSNPVFELDLIKKNKTWQFRAFAISGNGTDEAIKYNLKVFIKNNFRYR